MKAGQKRPRTWSTRGSELDARRDEVISAFHAGDSLAAIGARVGFRASGVQNWLRAQGEYDREVKCKLPECDAKFPFRPGKDYCTNFHARRGNARDRLPKDGPKNRIRSRVSREIARGHLVRPSACERCGATPPSAKDGRPNIHADHHHGYGEAHELDVWWICSTCDAEIEKLRRDGAVVDREHH